MHPIKIVKVLVVLYNTIHILHFKHCQIVKHCFYMFVYRVVIRGHLYTGDLELRDQKMGHTRLGDRCLVSSRSGQVRHKSVSNIQNAVKLTQSIFGRGF